MSKLKDYFAKKRKYRQQEKDAIKKQKELEKEIDKEYKEKYGKKDHDDIPNKLAKALAKFFDILWPDDEEQIENELNEYLTDEEKKKIEEEKKEEKKIVIFATTFMLSFITIITVLMVTYAYFNRTEYEKIVKPLITNYYKDHYNSDIEILSHNFICYDVKDEKGSKKEECTNLNISYINNNTHVLTINNEYAGDDVNQAAFKESYKNHLEHTFPYMDIVDQDVTLSYKDFYHDYYLYEDYSNILPINKTFEDLLNSNKLTINNIVVYKGTINIDEIKNYMNKFSDDSVMYLIQLHAGLPSNLTVIKKTETFNASFTNNMILRNNITYYELDKSINSINEISLKDIASQGINSYTSSRNKTEYEYNNALYITVGYERPRRDEPAKAHYYMIKFTNNSFIYHNSILIEGRQENYRELEKKNYPLYRTITIGGDTYVISDESIGLANKTEKKQGFLCNLGLC